MAGLFLAFVVLPTAVYFDYADMSTFNGANIINGEGYIGDSWMFFGVSCMV